MIQANKWFELEEGKDERESWSSVYVCLFVYLLLQWKKNMGDSVVVVLMMSDILYQLM